MLKLSYYSWLAFLIVFASCRNDVKTIRNLDSLMARETIIIPSETEKPDYVFPSDTSFSEKLLTSGVFHADEVWENAANENWTGLFISGGVYYLENTSIKTERVIDPIGEENEDDKTGWQVETVNKDSVLFLFTGVPVQKKKAIERIQLTKNQVLLDTIQFVFNNIQYLLFSTGTGSKEMSDPGMMDYSNYRLFLTAVKNGRRITEILAAQPAFDDNMVTILFVGDIDDDGFPDFIIDTSYHYNLEAPTLYLSKPAGDNRLLKVVAMHRRVGC